MALHLGEHAIPFDMLVRYVTMDGLEDMKVPHFTRELKNSLHRVLAEHGTDSVPSGDLPKLTIVL